MSMVFGMATKKVTVTIAEEQLASIRVMIADGHAPSVSGFVQHAIALSLDDAAGWRGTLDDALEATGGPLTDEERRWADEVLHVTGRSVA